MGRGKILARVFSNILNFRMALVCVMCDIPAARKVCCYAGHSAVHGCSKW